MSNNWKISDDLLNESIEKFVDVLPALRAKAKISQGDLGDILGLARQTIGNIERTKLPLQRNNYFALVMLFDNNSDTHDFMREVGAFPDDIVKIIANNKAQIKKHKEKSNSVELDEKAVNTLKTVAAIEYARCAGITIDKAIKIINNLEIKI